MAIQHLRYAESTNDRLCLDPAGRKEAICAILALYNFSKYLQIVGQRALPTIIFMSNNSIFCYYLYVED